MEIHHLPVISTAHLCASTAKVFTELRNENPWCPCAEWEFGFFLCLADLQVLESDCIPRCLTDIQNWLRSQHLKCTDSDGRPSASMWVRLDRDAVPIDGLPVYDW